MPALPCPHSDLTSQLHLPELLPGPVSVQVCGPDEGEMNTERPETFSLEASQISPVFLPVNTTAVYTYEDPVCDGGPGGILGATVKAHFITLSRAKPLENLHNISLGRPRHL